MRVLAGPGAGKTRVLAARVAHLVQEKGVPPYNVLAITFTNRAAGELRERLALVLGEGAANLVTAGTFHSVCGRILRRELGAFPQAGRTNSFGISDTSDGIAIMKRFLKDRRELSSKESSKEASSALGLVSLAKGSVETGFGMTGAGAVTALERLGRSSPGYFPALFEHYERGLRAANLLDFDDMISLTVAVLQEAEGAQDRAHRRYRHILVDEFQDTNAPQYALVQLLAGQGERQAGLFVVGDADQAIYGWRGADVSIIRDRFLQDYGDTCTTVQLSQNYRSVPEVLDAAAKVLTVSSVDSELNLQSLRTGVQGGVELLSTDNETSEAKRIARVVERAVEDRQVAGLSECAVLYRTNAQSRLIEEAMIKAGIPYALVGRTPFWDRQVVKDLMGYLKLVANPSDDTSLRRVINVPPRKIGKSTVDQLSEWAAREGHASLASGLLFLHREAMSCGESSTEESNGENIGPAEAVRDAGIAARNFGLAERQWKAVSEFLSLMEGFRALAGGGSPEDILDAILAQTGYLDYLQRKKDKDAVVDAEKKGSATDEDLIGELRNAIAIHAAQSIKSSQPTGLVTEARESGQLVVTESLLGQTEERNATGMPALLLFLQEAALVSSSDQTEEEREGRDAVRLMTLHACKGLEFNLVVIAGCEEGFLPHGMSTSGDDEEDMREFDEECRLCYVGATRAKQYLYLSHAQNRRIFGRPPKPRQLSRFVTAMGFKDPNAHLASEHAFGGRTDAYLRNWQKNRPQGRKGGSRHASRFGINDFGEADSMSEEDERGSWSFSGGPHGRYPSRPKMEVIIDSGPSPLEGSRLTRRPRARRGGMNPNPEPDQGPGSTPQATGTGRGASAPRGKSGEFTSTIKEMSLAPQRSQARSSSSKRPAGRGRGGPGRGRRRYADLMDESPEQSASTAAGSSADKPDSTTCRPRPRPVRPRPSDRS